MHIFLRYTLLIVSIFLFIFSTHAEEKNITTLAPRVETSPFIFSFQHILADDVIELKLPQTVQATTWLFPTEVSGNILFLNKANEDGVIFVTRDFGDIYLKDSFLYDDVFREKCEWKIIPGWMNNDGNPGSFDNYNPFQYQEHTAYSEPSERSLFRFRKQWYSSPAKVYQKIQANEVIGYKKPIWTQRVWPFIVHEFSTQNRPLILTSEIFRNFYASSVPSQKCYDNGVIRGQFLPIDKYMYRDIIKMQKLLNYEKNAYFNPVDMFKKIAQNNSLPNIPPDKKGLMEKLLLQSSLPNNTLMKDSEMSFPLMCVDPDYHATRADKDDWRIYCHLNSKTGDFFQYFFFEKELEYAAPLFLRDWALDHLAGVNMCKLSTAGVMINPKEKIVVSKMNGIFDPKKIIFALDKQNKPWRPDSVPEDKNAIPLERRFYVNQPGRIFGSYSKVWELDIWQRVGYMLKKHPEGIYLVGYGTLLQAEETQTVAEEHAFIQKHGVLITPELYDTLCLRRRFPAPVFGTWLVVPTPHHVFSYLFLNGKKCIDSSQRRTQPTPSVQR